MDIRSIGLLGRVHTPMVRVSSQQIGSNSVDQLTKSSNISVKQNYEQHHLWHPP